MKHKKSFLGALLLSALVVCAFGAANASALTMHQCENTGGSGVGTGTTYSDSTCQTPSATGAFETVPIPVNTTKAIEGTLTPTTAGMNVTAEEIAGTHAVLHFVAGGIPVSITCTGFSTPNASAHNATNGSAMEVTGTGKSKYTGCKITNGPKAAKACKVSETLETVGLTQSTEQSVEPEIMRLVYKPTEGTEFITINFENNGAETCPAAIAGKKTVTGTARGAVASPTAIEFTSTSGSELKIGEAPAQFTAVIHFATAEGSKNTIAIETP